MLHIGCHLSSSKGFLAMGRQAWKLGADTFQFFTRNPRGSKAKELDGADAAALRRKTAPLHGRSWRMISGVWNICPASCIISTPAAMWDRGWKPALPILPMP